jgi:hypothetical protein
MLVLLSTLGLFLFKVFAINQVLTHYMFKIILDNCKICINFRLYISFKSSIFCDVVVKLLNPSLISGRYCKRDYFQMVINFTMLSVSSSLRYNIPV